MTLMLMMVRMTVVGDFINVHKDDPASKHN